MHPTRDQIGVAAYHRWERRDRQHGHDVRDWSAAERELTFALNYEVVARYRLDGVGPRHLGDIDRPRCRFCEGSSPRVSFEDGRLALPSALGNRSLLTVEECDDCHAQFEESVGGDLGRFVASTLGEGRAYVPVAAFKGLVKAALAMVPADEVESFEATIEWVGNPDHDLDSGSISGMECVVHHLPDPSPFAWSALARRSDDEMPFPSILAFFGTGPVVFQVPIPLCVRDEDLDGVWTIPAVASPFGVGRGPLDGTHAVVALSSPEARSVARMELAGL